MKSNINSLEQDVQLKEQTIDRTKKYVDKFKRSCHASFKFLSG